MVALSDSWTRRSLLSGTRRFAALPEHARQMIVALRDRSVGAGLIFTRRSSGWEVFRHGGFRRFAASYILSGPAFQIQFGALGWFIYDLILSALGLGLSCHGE
ncbi:hypothetical protein SAMN02799622_01345 [Methylobacterium sp. UNC378MF]|uniref:hypothetical protein n=1 Tax=Methylobacterium sp. UNC378MF TaxID=1502748 RepID=UPI00088718A2|nr:hypothetical protein [Methylobacterium sp. UNC378MF]SDA15604.1 hypothetical protein SAMN02799622_01345 [Methylobacterium sp. UNC378MF]